MAKISRSVVDADLRSRIFDDVLGGKIYDYSYEYIKVNDRQYGVILTDKNGVKRYCRLGVIVAEEREDMTAEELMAQEIADYEAKQAKAQAKAKERARKAEADKARREAKAKEKGE